MHPRPLTIPWRVVARLLIAAALLWALLTGLGLLITRVLTPSGLTRWDSHVVQWFVAHRTPTLDTVTNIAGHLATTMTVLVVTVVAIVMLRLLLRRWRESAVLVVCVLGELVVFLLVAAVVHRQRPDFQPLDTAPPTSSFPSGHTIAAVALYGCLATIALRELARRWLAVVVAALCWAIPVVVGLSRLYRSMHFPTDVLAGALGGAIWLAVVTATLLPSRKARSEDASRRMESSGDGHAGSQRAHLT